MISSKSAPLLGCIADDVTGATDLATNLVRGGMRVLQVMAPPTEELLQESGPWDACVVALKTRSIASRQAVAQSLAALESLRALGAKRFYFKYCSTFDSTPEGNIGPVAQSLAASLDCPAVLYCPAFPRAGRTVFQGHLFVGDTLLSESGMQHHPLNPMTDANLLRVLGAQVEGAVGLLEHATLTAGAPSIRQRIDELHSQGVHHVICDSCDEGDLESLASFAAELPFVTGGSGLAHFLPAAYAQRGYTLAGGGPPPPPRQLGRNLVLAGSCSRATNLQVEAMRTQCPTWQLDVDAVVRAPDAELQKVLDWAKQAHEQTLMIASTSSSQHVAKNQETHGAHQVAHAIEQFFGQLALRLVEEADCRQIVVAGGETAGAVVGHLELRALRIGPEISVGVPWTESVASRYQVALAAKSGNFGEEHFFENAFEMLA